MKQLHLPENLRLNKGSSGLLLFVSFFRKDIFLFLFGISLGSSLFGQLSFSADYLGATTNSYLSYSDPSIAANDAIRAQPNKLYSSPEAQEKWDFDLDWEDFIDEPEFFEEKSLSLSFGIGLRTNVDLKNRAAELDQIDVTGQIPGLNLLVERQIWQNLGVGLSMGYQSWRFEPLNYTYHYFTGGLRAAYHVNLEFVENLDPYLGIGATFRMIMLTNSERNFSENTVSPHLIFGTRYFLTDRIGVFAEVSNDTNSYFKLGTTLYFEK